MDGENMRSMHRMLGGDPDGKFSLCYGRFLGYEKGEDGTMVINKDQATQNHSAHRRSRGDEIRKYLEDHPEITGYVILDDIPFTSFDACNLGDHLILTSERRGLTQKDADEAIRKLNGDMQAT